MMTSHGSNPIGCLRTPARAGGSTGVALAGGRGGMLALLLLLVAPWAGDAVAQSPLPRDTAALSSVSGHTSDAVLKRRWQWARSG